MEELLTLDGIGRKTANLVLGDAFGIPGIVVDTHAIRLSNRMGLTKNKDPYKIEMDLKKDRSSRTPNAFLPHAWFFMEGNTALPENRTVSIALLPNTVPKL